MNKRLIFWDFDGVMADSSNFVFQYWKTALNNAGHTFEWADYQATFTRKFPFDYLIEHFPNAAEKIFTDYSAYEKSHYPAKVQPFPGFVEGFLAIAPHYQHAVVSANLRTVIEPWLERHKLHNYFEVIRGREDLGHKDEKICHIMAKKDVNQSECLFIGDTISDVNHAKRAKVQSVAAAWGVHSRTQLEATQPDHICDVPEELFTLLKSLSLRG